MASNKFEICSRALNTLGLNSISSFSEDNQNSARCGDIWETFTRYLLSIYPWTFARAKVQLGRLVTQPINEYKYAYQLSGDVLEVRAVYASGSVGSIPVQNYEIFGSRILTNESSVWIDYQRYVEATAWPYWFVHFCIKALAFELAQQIPIDPSKMDKLGLETWGPPQDNRRGGLFGASMAIDSKQQPPERIVDFSLITGRFV